MSVYNKCSDIEADLADRLAQITKANGYQTDIGTRVFRGKRKVEDSEIPCAVLIVGEDRPGDNANREAIRISQDFVLGGYHECAVDAPNDTAHKIVADIKKAVFKDGPRLGGTVKSLEYRGKDIGPRADGVPIVFAVVHITVDFAETLEDA